MSQKTIIQTYKVMQLQQYFEHFKRVKWNNLAVNYLYSKIPKSFCCVVRCIVLPETFKCRIHKNRNVQLSSESLIHVQRLLLLIQINISFQLEIITVFMASFQAVRNLSYRVLQLKKLHQVCDLLLSDSNWLFSIIRLKYRSFVNTGYFFPQVK
jgi:hypothetical protein